MRRRFVLFTHMAVIMLTVLLMFNGARALGDDSNLLDDPNLSDEVRSVFSGGFGDVSPSIDQIRCFFIGFIRFANELVGHRFTILSNEPDAVVQGTCQIDFFRYDSNTLFRAKIDLAYHRIISTQIVSNTQPAVSPGEVRVARTMAEVGAVAARIDTTPGLIVTALQGTGVLAGGSSDCITDRCIELRYYGNADTGKGPVEEPRGEFFTFVDQQKVAVAIVDLTRQIVLYSEVFQ